MMRIKAIVLTVALLLTTIASPVSYAQEKNDTEDKQNSTGAIQLMEEESWETYFHHISGSASIYVPSSRSVTVNYEVHTAEEAVVSETNITWALDQKYTGVSLTGSKMIVSYKAEPAVVRLSATWQGHTIYKDIELKKDQYGQDLALGKSFENCCSWGIGIPYTGLDLATDGDSTTFFSSGKQDASLLSASGAGKLAIMMDLGSTKYNVIRLKQSVTTSGGSPLYLQLVASRAKNSSSYYETIVPQALTTKDADRYFKFQTRTEQYVGYYWNIGGSVATNCDVEFKTWDFEVYYDGSQLENIEVASSAVVDRTQETRIPLNAYNADGKLMTNLTGYTWTGSAQGCENIYIDTETNELVIPEDAGFGTYTVTLTCDECPELSLSATIAVSVPESEMKKEFNHISGEETILIPNQKTADYIYYVFTDQNVRTNYGSTITWSLAKKYTGVSISDNVLSVGTDAEPGTVTIVAKVGDSYSISLDVQLTGVSETVGNMLYSIDGQKFVTAPYFGEEEYSFASYTAMTYAGNPITEGIVWSLKGGDDGVSVDAQTGVITVLPHTKDQKVKLIAQKDGLYAEKLVTIVSRYEGGPNLLRLPGVTYSSPAASGKELPLDGDFSTASVSVISTNEQKNNFTFPQKYYLDKFRAYRDNGDFWNVYQTTSRINGEAFGGKSWASGPLEADIWTVSPPTYADSYTYTYKPGVDVIKVYEMEMYSSYLRMNRITAEAEQVEIPSSGSRTVAFQALSENGEQVQNYTYADGEEHKLQWDLPYPAEGVSIDADTGVLTVTSEAKPTTVTVRAVYFGKELTTALSVGSGAAATLAGMDYDWLTFDKLTTENADNITYKMLLPNVGPNGSDIQWSSSNTGTISAVGNVTLPFDGTDKNVTLTAEIKNGSVVLTKQFNVTVRNPEEFVDKETLTDNELFGVWDDEQARWAVTPKLDYSASDTMAGIGEAVKNHDLETAKDLLYDLTIYKLRNTLDPVSISNPLNNVDAQHMMNDTVLYTTNALGWINIGNERKWYSQNVKGIVKKTREFTVILHSYMKENALVEVDSRESEYSPYILVKMKNGNEMTFYPIADTTLRAGYYNDTAYGTEPVLKIRDSGYPIDSDTQRGYLAFDLSSITNTDDISSAELYLHGENTSKTGDKEISILYNASNSWEESSYCWKDTTGNMAVYSYSGTQGGFEFSFPPGSDPETHYTRITRMYFVKIVAGGFNYTGDEKWAYSALRMLDNYYNRAGDQNCFPRGFDGTVRNENTLLAYKCLMDSKYMTEEMTTELWKRLWMMEEQLATGESPYIDTANNMQLSAANLIMEGLVDFNEFLGLQEWVDAYSEFLLPMVRESILSDGCYTEAADLYINMGVTELAASLEKAKKMNFALDPELDETLHKAVYALAAIYLPDFSYAGYGDSTFGGAAAYQSFVYEMANLYQDDELLYISAHGNKGGTKPGFTSLVYPSRNRAYMRADWSATSPYLMIQADDSDSNHGHNDDLAVIAWAYGDFVLTDAGRYTYTVGDPIGIEVSSSANHNTLGRVTDLNTGTVYQQIAGKDSSTTRLDNWASSNFFDYYSGCARENTYGDYYGDGDRIKLGYNRKVLFVKPNYWIVSDYVENRETTQTTNQYDITFNLMPNSGFTMDQDTKSVKTNFSDTTNVQLVSPDTDVALTNERSVYCPISGAYTYTDRIVYSRTASSADKVTFDTVVFPTRATDTDAEVSAERLDTGVDSAVASAMHISRSDTSGSYNDYYYYSNEANFSDSNDFATRSFGDFSYNGEMTFISYDSKDRLASLTINHGSELKCGEEVLLSSDTQITDLSVSIDNAVMSLESSEENKDALGNVLIQTGRNMDKVLYNGQEIAFSQVNGMVTIKEGEFLMDTTVYTAEDGTEYMVMPEISYGTSFTYGGKSYAVTLNIPEGTQIAPIEQWDGVFQVTTKEAQNTSEAGRLSISTKDGREIRFLTPISIYVAEHATAKVYLMIDGTAVLQSKIVSDKDPAKVELSGVGAGIYTRRDHLWIITNTCTELIVGRINTPNLPENVGPSGGGSAGGGSAGGGIGGGAAAGSAGDTTGSGTGAGGATNDAVTTEPICPFVDLQDVAWAQPAIEDLYRRQVVNGKTETLFAPSDNVTRAEFITMLVRAFALQTENPENPFNDVAEGMWYTDAVATAYTLGVVKGISEQEFGTEELISRQDMMVMLYRILTQYGIQPEPVRTEEGIDDWNMVSEYASEEITGMYCAGIINGMGNGKIEPKGIANRAQAAKMIYETLQQVGETEMKK
ncbi:MAG: S-layer homology domain-containing protein [Clostridia bacterium]|nr:S-layer homology domain-containing protein [Clostridia bacterium]